MSSAKKTTDPMVAGALAGLLATVPMSIWMIFGQRLLSWRSQGPLPPAKITHRVLSAAGWQQELSRDQKAGLVAVSHFAYGGAAGAVYSRIAATDSVQSAVATGAVYGLAVWSGSYCGWLPAVGLYPPPTEDTAERTVLMIGAHLVWGSATGLLVHWLRRTDAGVPGYGEKSRANSRAGQSRQAVSNKEHHHEGPVLARQE
jgi:uncharacterized membrane protein YagU involved in acid resistance